MQNSVKSSRAKRFGVRVAVVAGSAGTVLALAAPMVSAQEALPPIPGAAVCNDTVGAQVCLTVDVLNGAFDNNGFNLPIKAGDMIITSALDETADGAVFTPRADGHNGLYAKPMTVPGGVLGIDLPFNNLFGLAGVTAEVKAVAAPSFNGDLMDFDISLPVKMKINNAFLGNNCYLGSETEPVNFRLKNANPGESPDFEAIDTAVKFLGIENVAEDFAIPKASGCGPFGVLNPIVNWRAKTPATAGTSLSTTSDAYIFTPGFEGSDPLDDLGGSTGSLGSSGSSGS